MKVKFIKKKRPNDFIDDLDFTTDKEYEVIVDYRLRQSAQFIADNGLVVTNDKGRHQMVFLDEFEISDNEAGETFIFRPKK